MGKEAYSVDEDIKHLDSIVITPAQKRTTAAFLVAFVLLVVYGILTKQGTSYALIVMIALAVVVTLVSWTDIDTAVSCVTKGVASQANMFLIFITIDVLLNLVTLGGGFDAISNLLGGLAKGGGATGVMLAASIVGGFGIEAAAVAEIKIIAEMFGGLGCRGGASHGMLCGLHPGGDPSDRLHVSHNKFCGPAGHRTVRQYQGGPSGLLGQCGLCVGVCRGLLPDRSHDPVRPRRDQVNLWAYVPPLCNGGGGTH